jgi:hypothetical protein
MITNPFPSGVETIFVPNPVPAGLKSGSVGNVPLPNKSEWDVEDDDGFPVAFIVVMLVFLVAILYRKQNRGPTPTQDVSTRGGYQPVASRYHTD